jgi:hypothetical protein
VACAPLCEEASPCKVITITFKPGGYGTGLSNISQRYSHGVRHPPMYRQGCGVRVNTGSPYRCALADTIGREELYAIRGL